ncbi:hypothetical protein SESBI_25996 [Sesbania bispinosa]|nr:hypothetical protein SESBI_25996 [Sesbania bispinosa]
MTAKCAMSSQRFYPRCGPIEPCIMEKRDERREEQRVPRQRGWPSEPCGMTEDRQ